MFEEKTILSQINLMTIEKVVSVQWIKQVLKDGNVISSVPHRKCYCITDKNEFLLEIPHATQYVSIMGW